MKYSKDSPTSTFTFVWLFENKVLLGKALNTTKSYLIAR